VSRFCEPLRLLAANDREMVHRGIKLQAQLPMLQLKLQTAKRKRTQFGRKSEKLDWQIEWLEACIEGLEQKKA